MAVVVDTNVAVVASRLATHADGRCVGVCVERLREVMDGGGLLVDDLGLILREYTKQLGFSGQPGAGHQFVKWAHNHQAIAAKVRQVAIHATPGGGWRRYHEFPDRSELSTFDASDQKFVAVARASGEGPQLLNAVDSDWWIHRAALAKAGVDVHFLCPQHAPKP